jgi:hypothetical protein
MVARRVRIAAADELLAYALGAQVAQQQIRPAEGTVMLKHPALHLWRPLCSIGE